MYDFHPQFSYHTILTLRRLFFQGFLFQTKLDDTSMCLSELVLELLCSICLVELSNNSLDRMTKSLLSASKFLVEDKVSDHRVDKLEMMSQRRTLFSNQQQMLQHR